MSYIVAVLMATIMCLEVTVKPAFVTTSIQQNKNDLFNINFISLHSVFHVK
jgi:hypothetical protein